MRQPGTLFFSLACRLASSTEFLMPLPVAVRSPERGTITPILTPSGAWRDPPPVSSSPPPAHAVARSRGRATTADHRQRRFEEPGMRQPPCSDPFGHFVTPGSLLRRSLGAVETADRLDVE